MLEELYAPLPSVDAYLERIGYDGPVEPSVQVLDDLIYAHLTHVPFENLDPRDGKIIPDLGIEALFDKVVTRKRGGYCFELNGLFTALLRAMGFECTSIATRGGKGYPHPNLPLHRGIIVTVDGERRWADVGYGKALPAYSLPVDTGEMRSTPSGDFRIVRGEDNWFSLIYYNGDTEKTMFEFEDHATPECDYILMNVYTASMEDSMFRNMRMLNLYTETGRKSIVENAFRIFEDDEMTEYIFDPATELAGILKEHFGIEYDV